MKIRVASAALAGLAALITADGAAAYSGRVKSACKSDFLRFCPSYKEDSSQLRACMRSVGGNLSQRCIDALVDAGEVPRKYRSKKR